MLLKVRGSRLLKGADYNSRDWVGRTKVRSMKSAIRFALLALVLVIVAMVSALTAMRFAIHGQEVAVPPVVGLAPAEAERAVAGLGLQISIERQYYSPQIPEGRIMSQLPLPGTKVRRGWQLRVEQSLGPTRVTIRAVTGGGGAGAESDGECYAGGSAEDQLAGDGGSGSAGLCDAELRRTVAGQCQPEFAGCRIQVGECECGGAGERSCRVCGESECCECTIGGWGYGSSSSPDSASSAGFAREHYCFASSGGGAESVCGDKR